MTLFLHQLKQACLSLKQKPGFVFSIVITMGVTLGTLLCVMTLAHVMLLKPLPYPDQERLVNVEHRLLNQGTIDGRAFTYPSLMYLYEQKSIFEQSTLAYFDGAVITSLSTEPMAEISFVTPEWFSIFDSKIGIGRAFDLSEQVNSFNPVAVISFEMWQKHYDEDKSILGKTITFNDQNFEIVGVLAEEDVEFPLIGPGFNTKVYIPWDFNTVSERNRQRWGNDDSGLKFVGKTTKDSSTINSRSQLDQLLTNVVNSNWQLQVSNQEFFKGWSIGIATTPLKSYLVADNKNSLILLLIGALGLVIIACANIANLFISRTVERQHQLAVCASVGARKRHIFGSLIAETSLSMFLSLVVAQIVAITSFSVLEYYLHDHLPRIAELSLNQLSLVTSIVILVSLTFLFSYLCLRTINFNELNTALQSSGKGNSIQVSKKAQHLLITSQTTVAIILVFLNIILYKGASEIANQPLGYQTDNIYSAVLALPNMEGSLREDALTELKRTLLASPKISSISQAMRPSGFGTFALTTEKENQRFSVAGKDIDHQYFPLIGQSIIEGDNFTASQIKDDEPVAIVNEAFAKRLAPTGSAIGMRFTNGSRVVGVVKSINIPGQVSENARFYFTTSLARNMLLIKVNDNQSYSRSELLTALKAVNSKMSLFSYMSLSQYKKEYLYSSQATATTTIVLTLVTFFLSGIGLYGVLNYATSMRRFEIGTRLAIGAKKKDIIALILKDNCSSLICGILISAGVLTLTGYALYEKLGAYTSVSSIILFVCTVLVITVVCLMACYVPLRQYITQPAMKCLRGSD